MRNNGRGLPRLGNNLARLRTCRRGRRSGWSGPGSRLGVCCSLGSDRYLRFRRQVAAPRLFFLFLLLGQNGLQRVARLGNVRQVDFRRDFLSVRPTLRLRTRMAG